MATQLSGVLTTILATACVILAGCDSEPTSDAPVVIPDARVGRPTGALRRWLTLV